MQGPLLPGGRFTIFHNGEVLAVRIADPIDGVTVVPSVGVRICNADRGGLAVLSQVDGGRWRAGPT